MLLRPAAAAARPAGRNPAVPLLCRALLALTLLLTGCSRLEGAKDSGGLAASQEDALLQFKAAFCGWGTALAQHRLAGWEPAATGGGGGSAGGGGPCGWSFVQCDQGGQVIKLDLSPAALWGLSACSKSGQHYVEGRERCRVQLAAPLASLTQPLGRLSALRELTLSGLGLTGSLPPEWPTALPTLQSLDLSGNALTGGLPGAWIAPGAWQELGALDLSHNPLGGSLPSILPAGLNETAARAAVQGWIDGAPPARLALPPPPPLRKLLLSGCQLNGSLAWDWTLLNGLMLLWLDDNRLTGTMQPSWGLINPGASHVEDLNLWAEGVSIRVQRNQLQGPVACCARKMMVQPGNEEMCLAESGIRVGFPQNGPHVPGGFTRQICSAAARRATYCSTESASLPSCTAQPAGTRASGVGGRGSAVAGGLAVAAGGVLAVAAASAAVGLRRRRRRRQRAAQATHAWDAELAILLPHAAMHQSQQPGWASGAQASSEPPSTGSGGGSSGVDGQAARPAGSSDGSGERLDPRSSWRLHSRSLQLQADDFQILLTKVGRPDLLGAGAFAKVYRGLLYGSQPVAIKVLAPAAACKLLDPSPDASSAAPGSESSGGSGERQQQQQGQDQRTLQRRQHERRMWREVELLRQCRHPNLVQLLGVYVSPGGTSGAPAQQQRRLMIVTELLEGGSLAGRLGEPEMRWHHCGGRVALDAARALAFLHQLGIAHRDVKSANILLTAKNLAGFEQQHSSAGGSGPGSSHSSSSSSGRSSEGGLDADAALLGLSGARIDDSAAPGRDSAAPTEAAPAAQRGGGGGPEACAAPLAKLADVGMARTLDQASISLAGGGTILYAAPEQLANSAPGLAADVFSLGWVIHEIATGERLRRRGEGRPLRAPHDCPAAIVQLVERCLQVDPGARPSAAEAAEVIAANLAATQPP